MTINEELPVRGVWCSRIALFSLLLAGFSLFLHRLFDLSTPTFFVYLGAAWFQAFSALLLGIAAFVTLWRERSQGAARIFLGGGVGLVISLTPLILLVVARETPMLNDVTTNTSDPPSYKTLEKERRGIANPSRYPVSEFATLQQKAYPDLQSLEIKRSVQDTYDLVLEILQRFQMKVIMAEPPTDQLPVGRIEAVHRTLLIGFYNDLVIRIRGDRTRSLIDLRSSSRYGKSDFGYNAQLLRSLMRELTSKLAGVSLPTQQDGGEVLSRPPPSKQDKKESPKKGGAGR